MTGPQGGQDAEDVEHLWGHFLRGEDVERQHAGSNGQRNGNGWNLGSVSHRLWGHLASAFQEVLFSVLHLRPSGCKGRSVLNAPRVSC